MQSRALPNKGSPDGGGPLRISNLLKLVLCFASSNLAFKRLIRGFVVVWFHYDLSIQSNAIFSVCGQRVIFLISLWCSGLLM